MVVEAQPWLRYGAIIGIAPFSLHNQLHQQWQRFYTLLLVVIIWTISIYGIITLRIDDDVVVSNLVSILVFLHEVITSTIIHLEALWTDDKYREYFKRSQRLRVLFRSYARLEVGAYLRDMRRRRLLKYGCFALGSYACLIFFMLILIMDCVDYTGYFWYALLSLVVLRTRCLLVIVHVDYIASYLGLLNRKLSALVSCRIGEERQFLDVNYRELESLEYLIQLKALYKDIFELCTLVNELFAWSIYSLVTVMLFDFIVNLYWTFLTLSGIYNFNIVYLTMASLLPLSMTLSMLCYSCDWCRRQHRCTSALVQRLVRTSCGDVNARIYNDLANEFLIQLQHCPVEISGSGFFIVDLRFQMEIMASIVTYIVILMQFRITI